MRYEVDIPAALEQRLTALALATGRNADQLICDAVGRMVEADESPLAAWSEATEARRYELIDKDIAGTITAAERSELVRLDRLANEYFDRVAPPPSDGARRLHEQLLQRRAHSP